ncbi:hypothetical protein FA13DRAFT_1280580 [Coprinellus micaceus]|uniref:Uncharacterized protein n=1 Tax=Coprinellus micaceus TaxID=71717 RepID=A0A4Y7SSN9_COPMI|nr:hypothetical protein FA13DRAFT_1280580 [Coprinellus micaceus]
MAPSLSLSVFQLKSALDRLARAKRVAYIEARTARRQMGCWNVWSTWAKWSLMSGILLASFTTLHLCPESPP